jgi:hypothetical protein
VNGLASLLLALREDLAGLVAPRRLAAGSELAADPPAARAAIAWRWDIGLLLTALAFAAYLGAGLWIARGDLYQHYNALFDLDSPRFVLLFADDVSRWDDGTHAPDYRMKHPFLLALRLPGLVLTGLGLEPVTAVVLMLALAGALTVTCAWAFLRAAEVGLVESVLLAVFFAGSCAQLFYASIIESYGFAALTLAFVHLAALMRSRGSWSQPRGRFLAALATFGVTSTNVAQAGLAEIAVWLRRVRPARSLVRTVSYSAVLALLLLVGVLAVHRDVWPYLADPLQAIKRVQWIGVLDEEEIPKGGPGRELATFAGYAFVAPALVEVPFDGGTRSMLDYREPRFSALGWAALALWGALLLGGACALTRESGGRVRLALYLACLAFNMLLHIPFQYRGSLFIVGSHAHFALFAIAAAVGAWSAHKKLATQRGVQLVLLTLVVLTLANNVQRLAELVDRFAR